ncbi:ELAV-like protein 1-B [Uloborus diversus]|uniref:ELAV-like protein 1-B n=1 Tax=Uloborus diversus TaxID=327109 RepID=UPI0024097413|nr:ELAV-like protein 1-B [Uloborus diversus]XP_054707645.1 ELAV-like protein 1-B [Uloborus diversus]
MDNNFSKNNLIVNYLPQMLTDNEFKNLFQSIGVVKAAKIVRHKSTGYSYGFGFVEYADELDAARAIETLNGFQLQNKRIKVAYSRPGGDTIKNANLYLRGVPKHMNEDDLKAVMAPFGDIIQCRLLKDSTGGRNKGVGFVLYDQHKQAEDAIKELNGKVLENGTEPLTIKYAEDNAKKVRPPPVAGGLGSPYAASPFAPSMGGRFAAGGPVRHSLQGRFRFNPMTNNMGGMNSYGFAQPGGLAVGSEGHILFVYNIGADTDEKTLWQLFARYGTVQKVNVIREGGTGQGKGYGFVTMPNYDEAVLAIESLNGCNFFGKPLQVSFKSSK